MIYYSFYKKGVILLKFLKSCLQGICIGAGAILPGISSGVLCVIFGIYDKLVESVLGIFHNFKKNFLFLFPIILGSFIGILLFGNILDFLFNHYPMPTKYAFIGLILGSIPLLIKKIHQTNTFHTSYLIYASISFGIGLLSILFEKYLSAALLTENSNLLTTLSTNSTLSISAITLFIVAGFFMSIGIVVPRG